MQADSLSCMAEMNQGQGKALRELLFRMLKMMLKAYLFVCEQAATQVTHHEVLPLNRVWGEPSSARRGICELLV